ncbi:hypothetical protein OCS_02919 [Ophiocordyceps sinensis CO18]|uniref:Uncharacterized protein n=1 Tax=Ophiocordyceps sinensis (strain Co18 / CGMCC 3.14243) TaxID=911162 RepID=T5A7B0_OPHSC|nr:hypothetical protein OCS_02919 [Ophiocordyceps sinensis CO18]
MDPPLSDAELIASFTPKEMEIYRWLEATRELRVSLLDDRVFLAMLDRRFPTREQCEEYWAFADKWYGRVAKRMAYRMPTGKFIDLIQETHFNNAKSAGKFLWTTEMTNSPFIFLGDSACGGKSIGYGIRTGAYFLWPNLDGAPEDPDMLDRSVLGINLNVEVEFRPSSGIREPLSSGEDSVESAEPDDVGHAQGFTFAQIGNLCVFADDWERAKNMSPDRIIGHSWDLTEFGAVVEVRPDGAFGAVWVIYGFYSDHPDDAAERGEHDPVFDANDDLLPHIGRLHRGCAEQFTVAKIANSLDDLRQPRSNFSFEIEARRECQIVRAKLMGPQRLILRQFINKSTGQLVGAG